MGSKWLRGPNAVQATNSGGNDEVNSGTMVSVISGVAQQTSMKQGIGLDKVVIEKANIVGGSNGDRLRISKGEILGIKSHPPGSSIDTIQNFKSQGEGIISGLDSSELFIVDAAVQTRQPL